MNDNFIYQMRAYIKARDTLALVRIALNLAEIEKLDTENLNTARVHLGHACDCIQKNILNLIKEEKCEK